MPTTPIGNLPGGSIADLIQELKSDLANSIGAGPRLTSAKTAGTDASKDVNNAAKPVPNPPAGPMPVADVASVVFSEVASSDITKLTRILDPTPDPTNNRVLDTLLRLAVQEVVKGNDERAVGYLADYATRDPRRAEVLPLQPELEPVRDKIDSMVSRMTMVAKMSAEDGLSRAEQTASELTGKLPNWDTNAAVLIKVAHHLFDAGGYANYSRTSELAKVVSDGGRQAKPADQVFAAAASASVSAAVASQSVSQMLPGVNVPYWASPDFPTGGSEPNRRVSVTRASSPNAFDDVVQNLRALKDITALAVRQIWFRAPLLVMLLSWFALGLMGGLAFAMGSRIWPDSTFVTIGNLAFTLWSLGFLALVGFGFYARVKYDRER